MKIGLYTDPHLSQTSSIIVGKKGDFSGRLNNLIDSFTWMNQFFKEQGCSKIVCLGDMTDKPNLTSEEITALSRCHVEDHILIVGNHCRSDKDGTINSLSLFNQVISSPTIIEAGCRILLLPYNSDHIDLSEYKNIDVILSHNDIKGYDYGNQISNSGYELSEILENCKLFINGHLHNGGWLVEDRIMNLGILSGVNFSSCGGQWEPSVGILDTETLKVEIFENPYAFRFKKIEVPSLPKLKSYLDNLPQEGYVLQIKVPENIAQKARKVIDQCYKVTASRILTVRSSSKKKASESHDSKINLDRASVYDKLRNFVKIQNPEKYSIDKINKIIDKIERSEGAD